MERSLVLIVEDNAGLREASSAILTAAGFEVHQADCVREARTWLETGGTPDALLTDINLGEGADGFDLAREARARHPDLPVVYMSALCAGRFAAEGVNSARFVAKPFTARDMLTALAQVLAEQPILAGEEA
ncbi:response regulator [Caulobacter sp. RHG1]|uniref:response regulator n=1 Tax=Caulobacter sp. (strain RHG1) TaxID=2545762 RepID=UPI00155590B5|nr:response regulator [Caulobacter sp. RHG1]NQE61715.1 hypothetical protein [Caulobacter sp. RHG1]